MNGSDARYTTEYVEIQTSLEHIRTRLESIECSVRDIHQSNIDLYNKVDNSRVDLAGVKATAACVSALVGSLIAVVLRVFFSDKV